MPDRIVVGAAVCFCFFLGIVVLGASTLALAVAGIVIGCRAGVLALIHYLN